jgi:acyl-CoA thioesterase-2
MAAMQSALDTLVRLLDLEAVEVNIFRGANPEEKRVRTFGGLVAGQALVAAGRTVGPGRLVHSLHAYFLRPGDASAPVVYQVDRIRDGRSFTTRRVVAIQHGETIFNLQTSFQVPEPGVDHQLPMPEAPDPETLAPFAERYAPYKDYLGAWYGRPRPIDTRYVYDPPRLSVMAAHPVPRPPRQAVWIRADGTLPEDPLLHACVVTYASDMTLLDSVLLPHDLTWDDPGFMGASLDHAIWFHRPFRADEWLLYDQESPSASNARGIGRGEIFTRDGRLVASVVQEGLVRVVKRP